MSQTFEWRPFNVDHLLLTTQSNTQLPTDATAAAEESEKPGDDQQLGCVRGEDREPHSGPEQEQQQWVSTSFSKSNY